MTTTAALESAGLPSLHRRPRWLLVGMHIPFIAFTTAMAVTGLGFFPATHAELALLLTLGAGALQLRHSLAAARDTHPRYWPWTFLLIVLIAYVPIPLFTDRWLTMQWFVLASAAMLLPGKITIVVLIASATLWSGIGAADTIRSGFDPGAAAWSAAYRATILLVGAGSLYAATRLVRLIDELREARASLAELAVGEERLRISRDLHDLLGQSLSAVSLKGDLAIGLLERQDVAHAKAEIEGVITVARASLRDLRDVAHRGLEVSFGSEVDRTADLLAAAGIETRMDIGDADPFGRADELFGWALREGVTNVLRHSAATSCSISLQRDEGMVRLQIENDGVVPGVGGGHGLDGLAARAAALSGRAVGRAVGDGRFLLSVEVPESRS